jgi:hypothetical protein
MSTAASRFFAAGLATALAATAIADELPEVPLPVASPLRSGDVPDALKRPRLVALLPVLDHAIAIGELFGTDVRADKDARKDAAEALLVSALRAQPFVKLAAPGDVRRQLFDDPATAALARAAQGRYRLGLDLYLSLATARAVDSLKEAVEVYRSVFQDVADPRPFADAQFMLGVALHEAGRVAEGHIALKDAFAIEPHRRFRTNFFPAHVNQALANALVDFRATADPLHPYGDNRRLLALAQRLGVQWLVQAVVRPGPHGEELQVSIFGAQRRLLEHELRVPLAGSGERVDAFVASWLACVPVQDVAPVPPRNFDVRLDTSGSYAMYQRVPTRKAFHSIGFAVGVAHEFRAGIEWFGRVNMYTSLSDPYRDLLHAFNSVRALGGLGFVFTRQWLRLYARPGLDFHLLGSFVASRDPECKLFGLQHKLCDAATVSNLDQNVLAGLNLALGGQIHVGRSFFVTAQGSASSYFLPLAGTDRLNFPLSAELGFGYRF